MMPTLFHGRAQACVAPVLIVLVVSGMVAVPAFAQLVEASAVTAEIRALQPVVMIDNPIWVEFTLHNPTDQVAVVHRQGATTLDLNAPEMGLPVAHVLGVKNEASLTVLDNTGREICQARTAKVPHSPIAIRLAPQATVGRRLDVRPLCAVLSDPGRYKLQWRPYEGRLMSNTIEIEVGALKMARIETDFGAMDMRFYYADAPRHVENFIELADSRFYDSLTFHRIIPGHLLQGGSPGATITGIRPDGKLLKAEFSSRPFKPGTVGMARNPSDPDSASCQFFICSETWSDLDGQYTAFAELVGGASFVTLDRLMKQGIDANGTPLENIYIRSIRVVDSPAGSKGSFSKP